MFMQRYHHLRFLGNRDRYLTRVHWAEYELLRTQIVFWASWLKTDRVDYRRTDNPGSITSGLCLATISQSPGHYYNYTGPSRVEISGTLSRPRQLLGEMKLAKGDMQGNGSYALGRKDNPGFELIKHVS
ncbi:hypothetical protein PCH_Pc22g19930 [Penicillium rubens Wisconsin 54-1255]|uniref:Uncharacterized protein n=1 Tax=Penicillium rubens (strain ATCC 28089 / DSM 1075 / NRRL 1951 / Wisconsin 54-1255) TaxID=500485 RepID=B6HQD5_PENRW|nr:hypothetical protein PCH_Pc22g19930 [Penicillium rubens Wisconsin 54-1255]